MKILGIFLSTILFFASASADLGTYKLEVERNGVTYQQVALNTWQGEYPGPVIDVSSKKKNKTTKVKGWESLRKLTVQKNCTIKNGLYHPWSQTQNSVINYYTIAPAVDYVVTKDVTPEVAVGFYTNDGTTAEIFKGDELVNYVYLGEGVSMVTWVQEDGETYLFADYEAIENTEFFKKTLETTALKTTDYGNGELVPANEQWLYVKCAEGYNVFIEDTALLNQKGVKQGNITGFGEIEGAN